MNFEDNYSGFSISNGLLGAGIDCWRQMCVHAQSCLTLCDPMNCSPPGSSVHGIFQARILEWITISYSRSSSQPRDRTCISCLSCTGRWILNHWEESHWITWEALLKADIWIQIILCWPESSFGFFYMMSQKNPNKFFGQLNTFPFKNTAFKI